jgi:hypothetical protein
VSVRDDGVVVDDKQDDEAVEVIVGVDVDAGVTDGDRFVVGVGIGVGV